VAGGGALAQRGLRDAVVMSVPPPPTPTGHQQGVVKPPPSWWWFVGPVVLLLGSAALFAGMLVWTVSDLTQVDARVPVDGEPHAVTVPTDGDRMLFAQSSGELPCVVRTRDGRRIEQRDVFGDFTMTRDGREWSGLTRFDPGDGRIVVSCTQSLSTPASEVLITRAVDVGGFVARIVGTILVPMALGGLGMLWAIILGVLILTRRASR
jgi:hypothetical protein